MLNFMLLGCNAFSSQVARNQAKLMNMVADMELKGRLYRASAAAAAAAQAVTYMTLTSARALHSLGRLPDSWLLVSHLHGIACEVAVCQDIRSALSGGLQLMQDGMSTATACRLSATGGSC
jgi:hypothetical protein